MLTHKTLKIFINRQTSQESVKAPTYTSCHESKEASLTGIYSSHFSSSCNRYHLRPHGSSADALTAAQPTLALTSIKVVDRDMAAIFAINGLSELSATLVADVQHPIVHSALFQHGLLPLQSQTEIVTHSLNTRNTCLQIDLYNLSPLYDATSFHLNTVRDVEAFARMCRGQFS